MKQIFFYTNVRSFDFTLGITRKIFAEIRSFKELGYKVTYSGYLEDGVAIFDDENNIITSRKYPVSNKVIQHFIRKYILIKCCIDFLSQNDTIYDFSYVRYHFYDRHFVNLLKMAKKHSKLVVVESHSEPKFPKGFSVLSFVGKVDSIWNKYAIKYVDLVATMANEDNLWNVRTVKIANGIDVESIPLHKYQGKCDEINLIAVSFESPVHGYDRILKGIGKYYEEGGKRNINFHIVGTIMNSTSKLIKSLKLQNRCILYGPKAGAELDEVYNRANIGIGCLANHRIGSSFGSALKTKEYIAKGIPFIYGWNERILENFEYAKKYDLCEDPIDIASVIRFYDRLDKTELAQRIRSKLGEEDTWLHQMRIVVDKVETLMNQ